MRTAEVNEVLVAPNAFSVLLDDQGAGHGSPGSSSGNGHVDALVKHVHTDAACSSLSYSDSELKSNDVRLLMSAACICICSQTLSAVHGVPALQALSIYSGWSKFYLWGTDNLCVWLQQSVLPRRPPLFLHPGRCHHCRGRRRSLTSRRPSGASPEGRDHMPSAPPALCSPLLRSCFLR